MLMVNQVGKEQLDDGTLMIFQCGSLDLITKKKQSLTK